MARSTEYFEGGELPGSDRLLPTGPVRLCKEDITVEFSGDGLWAHASEVTLDEIVELYKLAHSIDNGLIEE